MSFHLIHGHSHAHWCLSVLFLQSFYLLLKFLFHLFLIPVMVPDDDSMNDPCATPQSGAWSPLTMSHPTHEARSIGAPIFPPQLGTLLFPTTLSLRFASRTSLHESGRFDAPFSYNELVPALQVPRVCASHTHSSSLIPMVAPSSAFLLQLRPAPRCGSVCLEVQPRRPGHQARW